MLNCPKCNKQFTDETKFCDVCGSEVVQLNKSIANIPFIDNALKVVSAVPKKFLFIGATALAFVLVLAIIISSLSPVTVPNAFAYVKDGELNFSTVSKAKGEVVYDEDAAYYTSTVQISENGKRLFYIDEDGDLLCANPSSLTKEAKKVANSVDTYYAIGDGETVIFTNDKSKLYSVKVGKDPVNIDKDVEDFIPSEDGKKIIYSKSSDGEDGSDWYITKNASKAQKGDKLATGASLEYVSKDFSKFVYTKNKSLYSLTLGKEEYRIAKDVGDFIKVYDSGEIYFTCVEESNNDEDGYFSYSSNKLSLWYYAGNKKESVQISKEYNGYSDYATDCSTIVFYSRNDDYEYSYSLAAKDATYEIGTSEQYTSYRLSDDGKQVLYLKERGEDEDYPDAGVLCKATVSKGLKNEKVIDKNVSQFGYNADKVFYIKDYDEEDEEGSLYFDGKLVSSEAYDGYFKYIEETNVVIYKTDYDDSTDMCTFNFAKNGKTIASQEDVSDHVITNEGEVLMIVDAADYEGDLYLFKRNKKIKQIDTDVSNVFVPLCFTAIYAEIEGDGIIY